METTYTHYRKTARIRIVLGVLMSLLIHAGFVGFAALNPNFGRRPEPPPEVEPVDTNMEPPQPELEVPYDYTPDEPTPDEPTPPPDETPEPEDTPPPPDDMTFSDPTPEPTPDKPKPAAARPPPGFVPPPNAKRGPAYVPGVVGGVKGGTGTKPGGGRWVTPSPPYPAQFRAMRIQGSGSLSVTTDASGNVSSASISKSAGAQMDAHILGFARRSWKGPPNTTSTVPFTYQMR